MTSPRYLKVPFREKDQAKALGARWDAGALSWYVPPGLEISSFSKWLPAEQVSTLEASTERAVSAPSTSTELDAPKGVALSQLLAGVSAAVAGAFREGVWVRAEVMRVDAKNANVYLELSERTPTGDVLATGRGFIASRNANRILPEFQAATGVTLGPGIKVLVRAKPVFNARWGLSLEVDAIDASFTLGDMAARLREIRTRLQREGIFDANKNLAMPEDFELVLVVAPEDAAGLGDFRADADILHRHGVCKFVYAHARFQGDGCATEILDAAARSLAKLERTHGRKPDAVVVIRGGGAVNDLAWLNDYALARWICECPVPVFSGIGHERDNTILDEVAHTRFDTPSKVVAGIRDRIVERTRASLTAYRTITVAAERALSERRQQAERLVLAVKTGALSAIQRARLDSERLNGAVRSDAVRRVAQARQAVPTLFAEVRSGVSQAVADARGTAVRLHAVTAERAKAAAARARSACATHVGVVRDRSLLLVDNARQASEALFREVMGQGPQRTLARGFALVRTRDGHPASRAGALKAGDTIDIELADGRLGATVDEVNLGSDHRGEK